METIVEILELVGLVLVAVWIVRKFEGKHGKPCGCTGAGAMADGAAPDLSFPSPTGGCA